MAKFIKLKCRGSFNSFRQADFHTYHKTLPLPPKTTVAGMIRYVFIFSYLNVAIRVCLCKAFVLRNGPFLWAEKMDLYESGLYTGKSWRRIFSEN
ncbi:MAG: CRISPR-associated protein Cas5 [Phaeodactylibacter sp.]|nr:CRISPR-associated protein Cas5 [Phaeodactylibacter sp.]